MFGIATVAMLTSGTAWAACDKESKALDTASGEAVAQAFGVLARCDSARALEAFPAAVKRSQDVQSLATLSTTAIDTGLGAAVQGVLELIPDYAAREETARAIGASCTENAAVEAFVVGLHDALKDRAFVGWAGALRSCASPGLAERLEALAGDPPARAFDDKYATVVDLYATKRRVEALPVLEAAAQKAVASGPFAVVIDAMVKAVTPEGIGTRPAEADREALVASLRRLGGAIGEIEALHRIANALVTVEASDVAGELLPKLYPGKVQSDGSLLYGVASIERCGETSVVHWAVVQDPTKRWSVAEAVEAPARGFKPRVKKCDGEVTWTVQLTPEPVAEADEVERWVETVASSAGAEAKLRGEKRIVLR